MAFFTRSKTNIPMLPAEDGDEALSEDDWEESLEERRTPDGRSSKTSYELRRDQRCNDVREQTEPETHNCENQEETVVECKNPLLNPEPCYEAMPENEEAITEAEKTETKTEEARYDFVVDRVLGVQVWKANDWNESF